MTPILPQSLARFVHQGKIVLINPDVPAWIVTNEPGELILSLFDGTRTADDVVGIAVEGMGEDQREKIADFCRYALGSGLFDKPFVPEAREPHLHMVHLALSSGCNLRCRYCYAAERKAGSARALTTEEYLHVIDEIIDINPTTDFTLTGGEPLLNPDWAQIGEYIRSRGCDCVLMTNGLLISDINAPDIARIFSRVYLSIDGSNRHTHALTRGDNFDTVVRATEILERHGVEYSLSMTVTSENIGDVEAAAARFGSRLKFAPLFPVSNEANALAITGKEYFDALKAAAGVNPLAFCDDLIEGARRAPSIRCAMADGEISISAEGDVYPCQLLHMKEFLGGNVREKTLRKIFFDSEALQRCREVDVTTVEECRQCALRLICGGACRARSYYETGSLLRAGDFCYYEKSAILDGIVSLYSKNLL